MPVSLTLSVIHSVKAPRRRSTGLQGRKKATKFPKRGYWHCTYNPFLVCCTGILKEKVLLLLLTEYGSPAPLPRCPRFRRPWGWWLGYGLRKSSGRGVYWHCISNPSSETSFFILTKVDMVKF